jgi:hypothetical protein
VELDPQAAVYALALTWVVVMVWGVALSFAGSKK